MKHTTLALLALGTSACLGDGEQLSNVEQHAGGGCPPFACGNDGNSPVIDMFGFHDFKNPAAGPEANSGGFTLLGFETKTPNGIYKTTNVRVEGAQLMIGDPFKAPPVESGYLRIKGNGKEFLVYIKASAEVKYWAKLAEANKTHTYFLKWLIAPPGGELPKNESQEWPNVCSNPSVDNGGENMGMDGQHVVLFEGDRIDAIKIDVYDQDPNWFNIGCAGHALAKLHLSGHTQGAMKDTTGVAPNAYETKENHRTTYLKMISGDYCGDGRPFTIPGMPLNWADDDTYDTGVAGDWMNFASDNGLTPNNLEIEARWDENGATCLNTPRVDFNLLGHPEGKETYDPMGYADLEEAIKDVCGSVGRERPKKCDPDDEYTFDGHHLVTANWK